MVNTEQELASLLTNLRSATWVAVDTEADSLHAYPEKVCLIQVSSVAGDRLIDPLAGLNLAPFLEALARHELIMHGADYDLRLLRKHHDFVPMAIFDTMLAARLLGYRQFSLSHLVHKVLGVKLEKGPQKANWAVRPLTPRMESYARNDTRYLKPLSDRLSAELRERGRLEWHKEFCGRLINDSSKEHLPDMDSVWRIRGSHALNRLGLAVLREVWRWRESEAIRANKPPYFVFSHEGLVQVAAAAERGAAGPSGPQRHIEPLLPKHLSERRRSGLLKAISRGVNIIADDQPRILRSSGRRPSDLERRKFAALQEIRDINAHRLAIDPTLIASRSVLSDLAHNWDKHAPELMQWQRQLLEKKSR